jgi:nucleoside-diphosphate-sugar epimerase
MVLGGRDETTLPLFKMARGKVLIKPGLSPKLYSFVCVHDLVDAIDRVLAGPLPDEKNFFFVASDLSVSDEELLRTAARVSGGNGKLVRVPQPLVRMVAAAVDRVPSWRKAIPSLSADRARDLWPSRWVVSPGRFSEFYGWKAQKNVEYALQSAYEWYVKSGQLRACG